MNDPRGNIRRPQQLKEPTVKALALATVAMTSLMLAACGQPQPPAPPPAPAPAPAPAPESQPVPREDLPPPLPAPREAQPPTAAPPAEPTAPPQAVTPPPVPAPAPTPPGQPQQPLEVIETDSGLIIEILREGEGEVVRPGDTIIVHYHGTLDSGRVFDSSYERGEPARLGLFGVIRGWQEGIPGMRVGGKRRLIIPPELGYGRRGTGNIPPNSLLIFEIEVFDIIR
jgi:FKBP-type peptidyl-prolyl cis-trans isomerase FkpA